MKRLLMLSLLLCAAVFVSHAQPELKKINANTAHIVSNGRPMLLIGGEMGNSSASTAEDIERHFTHLQRLGLNTVLVPVS